MIFDTMTKVGNIKYHSTAANLEFLLGSRMLSEIVILAADLKDTTSKRSIVVEINPISIHNIRCWGKRRRDR